ncbi:MAG: ATP synthase F1 subunit gamma [Thermacetogeniaceae bacterium]
MPEQMRDIKRRIRSIKNTQQITKAMEMVAAARLRRSQWRVELARPYAEEIRRVAGRIAGSLEEVSHPLLVRREIKRPAFVVFTSDRGLCGAFNARVIRFAQDLLKERNSKSIVAVGRKGRDFFRRRGYELLAEFIGIGDDPRVDVAREIVRSVIKLYEEGVVDEVILIYMEFISTGRQQPTARRLLPIEIPSQEEGGAGVDDYLYEPGQKKVLEMVLPRFVESQVYRALLESKVSEHAARMLAMGNASENAGKMIDQLTLSFNKARQAAITKELTEIVTGAEALKG